MRILCFIVLSLTCSFRAAGADAVLTRVIPEFTIRNGSLRHVVQGLRALGLQVSVHYMEQLPTVGTGAARTFGWYYDTNGVPAFRAPPNGLISVSYKNTPVEELLNGICRQYREYTWRRTRTGIVLLPKLSKLLERHNKLIEVRGKLDLIRQVPELNFLTERTPPFFPNDRTVAVKRISWTGLEILEQIVAQNPGHSWEYQTNRSVEIERFAADPATHVHLVFPELVLRRVGPGSLGNVWLKPVTKKQEEGTVLTVEVVDRNAPPKPVEQRGFSWLDLAKLNFPKKPLLTDRDSVELKGMGRFVLEGTWESTSRPDGKKNQNLLQNRPGCSQKCPHTSQSDV